MYITKEKFIELVHLKRELHFWQEGLRVVGIYTEDGFSDRYNNVISCLLKTIFNKEELDVFEWWLFDAPGGIEKNPTTVNMWGEGGKEIPLYNAEELYEYLSGLKEGR